MLTRAPFQIFSPEDYSTIIWSIVTPIMLCIDTYVTPFQISFYADNRDEGFLAVFSVLIPVFFLLDIFLNFRTAFYDKGVLVTSDQDIFKHYLRGGFFIDFFTVVTDFFSAIYIFTPAWYIKAASILRLKKLWELTTQLEDSVVMSRAAHALIKMLKLWGGIIVVAHWLACAFHMLAYDLIDTGIYMDRS